MGRCNSVYYKKGNLMKTAIIIGKCLCGDLAGIVCRISRICRRHRLADLRSGRATVGRYGDHALTVTRYLRRHHEATNAVEKGDSWQILAFGIFAWLAIFKRTNDHQSSSN